MAFFFFLKGGRGFARIEGLRGEGCFFVFSDFCMSEPARKRKAGSSLQLGLRELGLELGFRI